MGTPKETKINAVLCSKAGLLVSECGCFSLDASRIANTPEIHMRIAH